MSLGYALAIRHRKDETDASKFLAIFAALVPGDILAAHAIILSVTTTQTTDGVSVIHPHELAIAFVGLLAASVLLYASFHGGGWELRDAGRIFIPPAAFVGWTMLQRPSAFDAVSQTLLAGKPGWPLRCVCAVFLALILIAAAHALDFKPKPPRAETPPGEEAVGGGEAGRARP